VGKGSFREVRGEAHDLATWHAELTEEAPFHRVEATGDLTRFKDFHGRFRRILIDQVSMQFTEMKASDHAIARTAEHIRAMPLEPYYIVFFQLAGTSTVQQGSGPASRLGPGDYTISTTRIPYRVDFDGDHTLFSLRFPQSFIDVPEQVLLPLIGQSLSSREGFGKYLAPFVSSIARDEDLLTGPLGRRVARNLVDLFATGVTEMLGRRSQGRSVPMFLQVTNYIANNLADPALDTCTVARANHISTRYLQALFQEQGTTVTDWVRDRRLKACRRDLADPALREESIGEIAHRWGYPDQAYFSRLFRRSFGESPREWRTRAMVIRLVG
jgi:AraC-like DNA-binding protein